MGIMGVFVDLAWHIVGNLKRPLRDIRAERQRGIKRQGTRN